MQQGSPQEAIDHAEHELEKRLEYEVHGKQIMEDKIKRWNDL